MSKSNKVDEGRGVNGRQEKGEREGKKERKKRAKQ